ncbi:hypothetical protein [Dongia sp.]|uniref:hypothetical protein n=1 Tax=Dongia sp. TaxID=1977262 RepID=UPI0035B2E2F6
MTILLKHGNSSSRETVYDHDFLRQLVNIVEYVPLSTAELFEHTFKAWLKSAEGVRVQAIIQGRKEIEAGNWHDFDDVMNELEAILRGDDPTDE